MEQLSFGLAMLLRLPALFAILCALAFIRVLVSRYMPDSPIKRFLLIRVNGPDEGK